MKKTLLIIGILLLTASLACAGSVQDKIKGVIAKSAAAPAGPNITFYFNCDDNTTGQSPTIGSGTVTIGASVLETSGQVGNALDQNNADFADGSFRFAPSGNISADVGTIGFWCYLNAAPAGGLVLYSIYDDVQDFAIQFTSLGAYPLTFYYQNTSIEIVNGDTTGEWQYIEITWSTTDNLIGYRRNGGSWSTVEMTAAAPTFGATIQLMGSSGYDYTTDMLIDQFLVSDEFEADLYSVRNNTSF